MNKLHISSKKNPFTFNIRETIEYKDLLLFLVLRDIKVIYKQTILGFSWAIIQPLAVMVIFTVIFGKLIGIEDRLENNVPYAVFSYIALVPWIYFSSALTASSNSLIGGANLLSKVYFPRIFIPLTPILAKLVDFTIALIILIFLLYFYGLVPHLNRIIYLPIFIFMMVFTAFGAGLWLSAMAIKYRDVRFLLPFISQLLMFATPIIWPMNIIPEKYHVAYALYPMVGVIEGFREAIIGTDQIPWDLIKMGCISSIFIFVTGIMYFKRKESYFADVV